MEKVAKEIIMAKSNQKLIKLRKQLQILTATSASKT